MSDIGPLGILFAFQTYFVPDSNPIVGKIFKILYFSVALCSLQLEQAHANEINTVLDKNSIEKKCCGSSPLFIIFHVSLKVLRKGTYLLILLTAFDFIFENAT